jgi:hypothetical protein
MWYFRLLNLDSDNDGILDSVETNWADADGIQIIAIWIVTTTCVAMLESGFTDPDGDGKFGNSPVTVDLNGLVMAPCILFLIQII